MADQGVPITIVEKIIEGVKEVAAETKTTDLKIDNLEDAFYKNLDKVADGLTGIATRLNTPPRHEEIIEAIKEVKKQTEETKEQITSQNDHLNSVLKTIKIGVALFGTAILIASIIVAISSHVITKDTTNLETKIEKIEKNLQEHVQKSEIKK